MLACQAIKYPIPGEESNFPRERKKDASFARITRLCVIRPLRRRRRGIREYVFLALSFFFFFLSFAREIEKNVTKNFLQNEIYRYLLITLRSNFVIHSYLLLIRNLLHVLPDDS